MHYRILYSALFLIIVLLSALPSITPAQPLQLTGDFESGVITDLFTYSGNSTTHTITADSMNGTAQVRTGRCASYMSLTRNDPVNYRSELTATSHRGEVIWGNEYWLGFSFRLKDWGVDTLSAETLFQLHAVPHLDPVSGKPDWDCVAARNVVSLWADGPLIKLAVVNTPKTSKASGGAIAVTVWSEPWQSDVWYDWVLHLRISTGTDGLIEMWRNGEKIYTQNGGNADHLDSCGGTSAAWHYLKVGIYKWDWKTKTSQVARREMFYDDIRIGNVNAGYAGGYAGVAPGQTVPDTPTSIEEQPGDAGAHAYLLKGNYPNPFNPGTTISYEVFRPASIHIDVFDGLGRHVKSIIHAPHQSGQYRIDWDGTDEYGALVPSGLYFCRLASLYTSQVKKMLLLR